MPGFAAIERELIAEINGFAGPEASIALAGIAATERDKVVADAAPYVPTVEHFVDGSPGRPLAAVKPDGTIRFEFTYGDLVAQWILEILRARSPYQGKRPNAKPPTHYRDEHAIFLNGREVETLPAVTPAGSEIVFVNLQPYSRKIERGFSMQAPNGVYEAVASLARTKFRDMAEVRFGYREFPGAGPGGPAAQHHLTSRQRVDDRFPAITVVPR